jgi:hypothetical protein
VFRDSQLFCGLWFLTYQVSVSLMSGRLFIVSLSSNNYRLDQVDMTFGLCSHLDVRHMAANSPSPFPLFFILAFPWHFLGTSSLLLAPLTIQFPCSENSYNLYNYLFL